MLRTSLICVLIFRRKAWIMVDAINRRDFMASCLVAASSPAFAKSVILMGLWVPDDRIISGPGFSSEIVDKYLSERFVSTSPENVTLCDMQAFMLNQEIFLAKHPESEHLIESVI